MRGLFGPGDPGSRARAPGAGADRARLRLARRAARIRARPAAERAPAGLRHERRGARGRGRRRLPLPLARGGSRARSTGRRGRRRPLGCAPAARCVALPRVVRLGAPEARGVELRAAGALPAAAAADREPRLLRDGDAARARADRRCDRPGERRHRCEVGRLRCRPHAQAELARRLRARQPLAVSRRHASAHARDRASAGLSGLLRAAPAAGEARAARHVLRARDRGRARAARRCVRHVAGRARARRRRRAGARARRRHRRGGDRALRGPLDGPLDRRLRARQPRQGRRRPGGAERQRRARLRRDRGAAARGSARMSVTAAKGFTASGVAARISKLGPDLALVHSELPAVGAGMFTANRVQAAPVLVSKEHLELAEPQAVVVNSGNANAATGAQGIADARATAAEAASVLGLAPEEVVVLSTGVIGQPLPIERLLGGIPEAASQLSAEGGASAAQAILTTDTCTKEAVAHGDGFTVGGMAKGSGMIHPNLATMLAVITTDYPLDAGEPIAFLRPAVEESFNSISVDGECSTNDSVILLANGASNCTRDDAAFAAALHAVCADLAAQIVADGEGATVIADIAVTGAASTEEAKAVAQRIATSPLVKTALFGKDAN